MTATQRLMNAMSRSNFDCHHPAQQRKSQCLVTTAVLVMVLLTLAVPVHGASQRGLPAFEKQKADQTLTIATDGKANVPIVIPANASDSVRDTAAYLAAKLKLITGATFQVTTASENASHSTGLLLGRFEQFPDCHGFTTQQLRIQLSPTITIDDRESYVIRTEADRVLLLGAGDAGISHATAQFLHAVGYRRYYPAIEWEIASKQPTLKFAENQRGTPAISHREIWYAFGIPDTPYLFSTEQRREKELAQGKLRSKIELGEWERQNLLGESFDVFISHNWAAILTNNRDLVAAHPEYMSLIDGKRVPRSICPSHPAVRQLALQEALKYFAKNPNADMYSMERGDGNASCECELCVAQGTESNRVFGLANEVAKGVAEKLPGKMIGVLAYNTHDLPPSFDIHPNVHVSVAELFNTSKVPMMDRMQLWRKKTQNLGVYAYFSTYQWGQDRIRESGVESRTCGPTANLAFLQNYLRQLIANGAHNISSESSVAWGAHGLGNYVATRLLWEPDADVNTLVEEFCTTAFGPAVAPMQRYFQLSCGSDRELLTDNFYAELVEHLDQATRLAQGQPQVLARLDHIKQFIYYNYLIQHTNDARDQAEKKALTLEKLTHECRTRYTYMTHWKANYSYLPDVAKRFNEPSWSWTNWKEVRQIRKAGGIIADPPWWVDENYTQEETERIFRKAASYWKKQELLPKVSFSDDLLPVDFSSINNSTVSSDYTSLIIVADQHRMLLYSFTGEPLVVEVKTTARKSESNYTITDAHGVAITQGRVTLNGSPQRITAAVPKPGLYRLDYEGDTLNASTPVGSIFTLPLNAAGYKSYILGGGGRSFFYVPKGTTRFQYFWQGGKHRVEGPGGATVKEIEETRKHYVTVTVPAGMDGQVWSFVGGELFGRRFVNIPDYIAPRPDALLIPREVVERDKLPVRRKP